MVENNMTVKVTNRDNGSVGYSVPDLGVHRTFQPRESKEISAEELRKLSYLPGGDVIIRDYLIIDDAEVKFGIDYLQKLLHFQSCFEV